MTIKCPYCGAVYDIEENECGCRARCEVCGKWFVIGHVLSYSEYRKLSEPARSPIDVLLGGPKVGSCRIMFHMAANAANIAAWKWPLMAWATNLDF